MEKMTESEFYEAIFNARKPRSRISVAAKMVIVDGCGILQAAREMKINKAGVSRLVKQIRASNAMPSVPGVPSTPGVPS